MEINLPSALANSLNSAILASNYIVNQNIIKLMTEAKSEIVKLMEKDVYMRFKNHMNDLEKQSNKTSTIKK